MPRKQEPDEVSSQAWDWYSRAQQYFRKTDDGSPEEMAAIQAMATAATAGLTADWIERAEKRR